MSRRALLRFGALALGCGVAGCGDSGGAPTPTGKPANESGSLKRLEKLKKSKPGATGK